jgi:protein CpxP
MKSNSAQIFSATLAACLLALLTPSAVAVKSESTKPATTERAGAARKHLEATLADLNLSPEQKEKLTPLLRKEMEKMAALRADQSLSRRDKFSQMKTIRDEFQPQVKAILTPEQFATWEKKREEVRGKLKERVRERKAN